MTWQGVHALHGKWGVSQNEHEHLLWKESSGVRRQLIDVKVSG